jgi:hypothetical protein
MTIFGSMIYKIKCLLVLLVVLHKALCEKVRLNEVKVSPLTLTCSENSVDGERSLINSTLHSNKL